MTDQTTQADVKAHLAWMHVADREGRAAVIPGRGHSLAQIEAAAEPLLGPGPYEVHETFLQYTPRVMWCERIDGFGCDSNGDWHGHWSAVKQNPFHPDANAQTIVFQAEPTNEPTNEQSDD